MPDLLREHFQLKETIATISARDQRHIEAAKRSIHQERRLLEDFIGADPFFMLTLEPYDLAKDAGANSVPEIVRQMASRSAVFGIGPMAAVAGTIAKFAVQAMIDEGARYAIVDNGGDISILNDQPILVGIYAGASPIQGLAFEVSPRQKPLGIATSSGTVGPSISFGCADAATVVSQDLALADAAATALGNAVQADNPLDRCFQAIDRPGIDGALVIRGEEMALWGALPPLRRARVDLERITRA
ncbi:MAG: hypothetical protein A4E48_01550 [Methanosaeta sp. PtaU1.Bin060]|nr:MAG: hypothetical protein A4E48_01550 [Methanosaeta sp. PtaU1.Bin060]